MKQHYFQNAFLGGRVAAMELVLASIASLSPTGIEAGQAPPLYSCSGDCRATREGVEVFDATVTVANNSAQQISAVQVDGDAYLIVANMAFSPATCAISIRRTETAPSQARGLESELRSVLRNASSLRPLPGGLGARHIGFDFLTDDGRFRRLVFFSNDGRHYELGKLCSSDAARQNIVVAFRNDQPAGSR